MANNLLTQQESKFLALVPAEDQRAAAVLRSCLSGSYREFGTLMMQRPPVGEARQILAARQTALVGSLKANKKEIGRLVAEMLQGYRHKGVRPDENADQILDLYWRELSLDPKVPTWAVWRACMAIRAGSEPARLESVGVRMYEAPTTMMLRALCDTYVREVRAEMMAIGDVLQGRQARPEVSAEEQERTAAKFTALAVELKERNSGKAEMAAPLSRDALVEMAGSEEAFAALPDIKPASAKTVADLIPKSA